MTLVWLFAQKDTLSKREPQDLMVTIGVAMDAELNTKLIQDSNSTHVLTLTTLLWIGAKTALETSKISVAKNLSDKN